MYVSGELCIDYIHGSIYTFVCMHSERAHPKFLKGSGGACPQCLEKLMLSLLATTNPH